MSRKRLITLGVIVAVIALGTAVWGRSSESPSPTRTPEMFVPPTTDPMTAAAERAARQACREHALAYDPRARTPDLAGCNLSVLDGRLNPQHTGPYAGRDFTGANFSDTDLVGTTFAGANFTDANFTDADLGMELIAADFINANFTGANLTGARLPNVHLDGANFTNANLRGAYFYGFGILGDIGAWATFTDAIWANTICPDGTNSDTHGGTCANNLYVHPSHRPSPAPDGTPAPSTDQ